MNKHSKLLTTTTLIFTCFISSIFMRCKLSLIKNTNSLVHRSRFLITKPQLYIPHRHYIPFKNIFKSLLMSDQSHLLVLAIPLATLHYMKICHLISWVEIQF